MKINKITSRYNNDFYAIFECTKCGHTFKGNGYEDRNYYENVIPNAICPECGLNCEGENEEQLKQRLGRTYKI